MKNQFTHILITIAVLFSSSKMYAQLPLSANYTYSTGTSGSLSTDMNGNPIDMTTQTSLGAPALSQTLATLDIGFDFYFMGTRYTQHTPTVRGVSTLGWVTPFSATPNYNTAYTAPVLHPFWAAAGFNTGAGPNLRTKVVGTAPNRCMVFEWRTTMVGSFNGNPPTSPGGNTPDFVYQMRLYETTGAVEYVYGQMQIPSSYTGAALLGAIGWVNNSNPARDNNLSSITSLSSYAATTSLASANVTAINASAPGAIPGLAAGRFFRWIPSVPSAPTSLVFSGVSSSSTTLTWTDNSTNEFGFAIYRSDDGGATYNFIAQTALNVNTFTQSGLQSGTTYMYRVHAMTEGGLSTAVSGTQATTASGSITSAASGNWSAPSTWTGGVVPISTDNVTIANGHTVTIDIPTAVCNNLTVGQGTSGILRYSALAPAGLIAFNNVTVASGGIFDVAPSNIQTHTLAIGGTPTTGSSGSLTVNGSFDMNQVSAPNTGAGVLLTFGGQADGTISGSGPIDFYSVTVNKGFYPVPAQNPVLNVTSVFTMNAPVALANRLTLTSGTFKISSASTITPYFGSQTICATGGRLWLNHASANVSCVGTGTTAGQGSPTAFGEFRIDDGVFAYGSGNNTFSFSNASLGGVIYGSKFVMNGGTMNIFGAFQILGASNISFTMTGGNINIDPQAATFLSPFTSAFTISGSASATWSGGTVTIIDPPAGSSFSNSTVSLQPGGSKSITGGTLRIGDGISGAASGPFNNASGYNLSLSMGVWNLVIDNRTDLSNTRQCRIGSPFTFNASYVLNTLTINNNATLMLSASGSAQTIGLYGDLINNGVLAGPEAGSVSTLGTIQFLKPSGTQTVSGSGSFYNIANLYLGTFNLYTTSTSNLIFSQTNTMVVNQVTVNTGTFTHNNKLTIGRPGVIPTVILGGNGITTPSGSFTSVPNFDNTSFNTALTYNMTSEHFALGVKNEIGAGTTNLYNLTINNPKGLSIDRNLNIVNSLTMTVGDILIGNNNITLGTGASNLGSLSHNNGTSGQIICGTSGGFTRWVNTVSAPTSASALSLFPLGTPGSRRQAFVYYNASNALSAAGTVTARHADAAGTSSMSSFTENSLTMDTRSNAGWVFSSGNGLALSGTVSTQLVGEGAIMTNPSTTATNNILNNTITNNSGSALGGTYAAGSGTFTLPVATRTGMNLANLTSAPLYIGAPSGVIGGMITAINSGNWATASTWNTNSVPTASDNVIIADTVQVTCAGGSGTYACNNILLPGNGSKLTMNNASNTLNIGGQLFMQGKTTTFAGQSFLDLSAGTINVAGWDTLVGVTTGQGVTITNGNVNISGGTFNLSNAAMCKRNFLYNSGNVYISGGAINIFGKMQLQFAIAPLSANVFQTAGTITIDPLGTAATAATSCSGTAATESAFYLASSASVFSGGSIVIVDPPYNASLAAGAHSIFLTASSNYNCFMGTHTVQLGDGTSTSVGIVPASGFPMECYSIARIPLNNVIINGGNTTGRHGASSLTNSTAYGLYVKNLTINSGSEFIHSNTYNNDFFVAQSLVNNGTLTQSATTPLILGFGGAFFGIFPGDVTLSGSGTFRNLATSPTASFTNLQVHMGNPMLKAIISPNNLSVSSQLSMTSGNIDIGTNNFTLGVAATPSAGTLSWTSGTAILNASGGTFSRVFATTGLPTFATTTGQFPMGRYNPTTFLTENRSLFAYFTATNSLGTGGTISVGHAHSPGFTTVTPFADGALNINSRTNSSWSVTNSGLALASGNIFLAAVGTNTNLTPVTIANTTLCQASAAAGGSYLAGSGTSIAPQFNRAGMIVTDITAKTFYGGVIDTNNLGGSFVAVTNGNWDNPTTWNVNAVPTIADAVDIPSPYTVILGTGATHASKSLNIQTGGALIANNNTLTVAERIINAGTITLGAANLIINNANKPLFGLSNSGTFTMNGGTMRIGPVSGGAATLLNTNILTINDGTINLNGNYVQTAGTLTMTPIGAATMNIDGNDGSTSVGSVASTIDLFSITGGTQVISGGQITIVDPPFGSGMNRAFNLTSGTTWTNNILNIGDGASTTTSETILSGRRTGFRINSSGINVGNVVIRGGNTVTRWASIANFETFTCTNLTINPNSELRTLTGSTGTLSVTANIVNAGKFVISQAGTLTMNGTNPQTFTNTGTFTSDTSGVNTNQISNLTISNTSGSGVDMTSLGNFSIGFGTMSSGILSLTNGPLNIGGNTLTLGTASTVIGTLTIGTGAIIHSNGGGFQRWIPSSGAPTSVVGALSQFPLGVLVNGTLMRRDIWVAHSSSTLTAAGTMRASHTNTAGLTAVTPFTESGISYNTRSNSFWTVTTANGYNSGAVTFSPRIQGSGMVSPKNVPATTIMGATGALASGSNLGGGGTTLDPQANRTAVSFAALTGGNLYFGGPDTNLFQTIQSAKSGNWSDTSTWTTNTVPASTDNVLINSNHAITLDANGATRDLTMNSGSILNINANTLTVNNNYLNNSANLLVGGGTMTVLGSGPGTGFTSSSGTINLSSGTINLGQGANFNRTYSNTSGNTVVTGGNLNVNGNVFINSGTFSQSGGTITVDGNDGSTAAGSAASGTALFNLSTTTQNVTGGTIRIVDPPFTGTAAAFSYFTSSSVIWTGHTLQLGDGTSTHAGSASPVSLGGVNSFIGFNINTSTSNIGGIRLHNMIVNGGSGTNRFVTASQFSGSGSFSVGNNLTINSGSELRTLYGPTIGGANINVGGNIINNGTLVIGPFTTLALRMDGGTASTSPQTISGSGIFTNVIGGTGAPKFSNLLVNNLVTSGVDMSGIGNITIDDVNATAPTLTLTSGILRLGSNNITIGSSTTKPGLITLGVYAPTSGTGMSGTINTTGTITRWFGTALFSAPFNNTGTVTSPGMFPFSVMSPPFSFNRTIALSNTSALTAGGTVTMSHKDSAGVTTGFTPFADSTVNVDSRANFNWTITPGNGLTSAVSALGYQACGSGLTSGIVSNIATLRMMQASTVSSGNASPTNLGTADNPVVIRTGLDQATLASTVYIGGPGLVTPIINNVISAGVTSATPLTPPPFTGTLPSGGSGTYAYQWLEGTSGPSSGFTAISGATTQNYTVPSTVSVQTWYRRVVISGAYTDTSNAIEIIITIPTIIVARPAAPFSSCAGKPSAAQFFNVSGSYLIANIVVTAPSGFEVSTSPVSGYGATVTLTPSAGLVPITKIYTRLTSAATGSPSGNLSATSTSATTKNTALSGTVGLTSTSSISPTVCNTYTTPSGKIRTASAVFTDTILNAVGCDSVITINLTIKTASTGSFSAAACGSYLFNGITRTTSGAYLDTLVNAAGCDSFLTLNLTINSTSTGSISVIACNSYLFNGNTQTTSGAYLDTLVNAAGCDSFLTLNLTINSTTSTGSFSATACSSYLFNGNTQTTSGAYLDTLVNAAGCDSFLTLNLTINSTSTGSFSASACGSYLFNGITRTTSGAYLDTLVNAIGCDSFLTLNLTINNSSTGSFAVTACNSYTFNGASRTTSGAYLDTLVNAKGCDSFLTLNLTINNSSTGSFAVTACNSYIFNGASRTTSGTYLDTLVNAKGCDSFLTLNLTINNSSTGSFAVTACNSYTFNGASRTTSGTYLDTLVNAIGCDSFLTLNLTINPASSGSFSASACGSYLFNGITQTTSGVYLDTLVNAIGCDSFLTLNLTINNSSTGSFAVTACNTYTFNGATRTTSGAYLDTLVNAKGCDSFLTLNLTINNSSTGSFPVTACNSYIFNGATRTTSGAYLDTLVNVAGCDSFLTLNLTINNSSTGSFAVTSCNSYTFNGATRTTSGAYLDTLVNAKGCDSFLTLNLTINNSSTGSFAVTACNSYTFNGASRTTSGTYLDTLVNAKGCDSFLTLNLTIRSRSTSSISPNVCNTYTTPSGKIRTASATFNDTILNAAGCDSVITINLTIRSRTTSTISPNVCNTYTTPSGKIRTASATFNDTIPNVAGCDSVITINLTIRLRSTSSISPIVCYTYTSPSGKVRTASAMFNDTIPNAVGCDSIIAINLTINNSSTGSFSVSACNSYFFNGALRVISGVYRDTLVNARGCDSFLTLNLTINNSSTGSFSVSTCNSYFFNGALRTSTGAYRDTLVNAKGCDSFLTLNLTINSKSRVFNVVNCYGKPYLWNGVWRNVSGTYIDTFRTILGCDSVVTLNLKIDTSKVNTLMSATICAGKSYFFNNANLTVAGVYQDTFVNQFGCDSFIILTLKVNSLSTKIFNVSLCNGQSYLFKGINRKTSGIYRDTLVNAFGCDSFIILNLTIHALKTVSISKSNDSLIATSGFANYQWFKDLSLVTGQNQNVYKPSFSGTYSVKVTDSNNCSFASAGFVYVHKDPTSGISTGMNEKFNVFPNPAIDFINIESDMFAQKDCQIMVYSIDGKLLIAQEVKTRDALQTLSISDLSNGSYILRLVQGDTFKEVKFVVDK